MDSKTLSERLKQIAYALGADFCGISRAEFMEPEAQKLETWLKGGYHGKMHFMERYFDIRTDPRKLMPGAKSVISLIFNYFTPEPVKFPKISRYARGEDYHVVLKNKLNHILETWRLELGHFEGRICIDSAPVMEKAWAQRGGLGWIGKNTHTIRKGNGSYFFITEIITDLEPEADSSAEDLCGTCSACVEACPTGALDNAYILDSRKCISYLTIELKEQIPAEFGSKMEGWMFGCDICQEVCPWNRFKKPTAITEFKPTEAILNMDLKDWLNITEPTFKQLFKKSAMQRAKYSGIMKNLQIIRSA